MLKNNPQDFMPQDDKLWGIYRGVVEDNNDPDKMGRCRIRVYGIHTERKNKTEIEGIPIDELPWAEPVLGLFEGSLSGYGAWNIPLQGSHVFLFFENGHMLQPRFFASVPGWPKDRNHGYSSSDGFSDPDNEYPDKFNEPDWHRLARGDKSDTIVESKEDKLDLGVPIALNGTWDEPDPYYAAEYPKNKVFATRTGITIEIDDTDGNERIHVYHPSNSYIEINHEGSVIIRNAKDKFEIVDENKKTHIMNDYDRTVDNNRTSKVGANENEEIGNNLTMSVGGNKNVTISGQCDITVTGDCNITSGGTVNINGGPLIHLNK